MSERGAPLPFAAGEAIRDFVGRHGQASPRRAIYCTADFDAAWFESALLPLLQRRGRGFRALVLADAVTLRDRLAAAARAGPAPPGAYAVVPVGRSGGESVPAQLLLLRAGARWLVAGAAAGGAVPAVLPGCLAADARFRPRLATASLAGQAARILDRLGESGECPPSASARVFLAHALAGLRRLDGPLDGPLQALAAAPGEPAQGRPGAVPAVLAAFLRRDRQGARLLIEAPSLRRGEVLVAAAPGARAVAVPVEDGLGVVREPAVLRQLDAAVAGDRATSGRHRRRRPAATVERVPESRPAAIFARRVLWERAGRWHPFPVSLALLPGPDCLAADALVDLAWEELGAWPPGSAAVPEAAGRAASAASPLEGEDGAALAKSAHEGELDRLGVAIGVLRRRLASGGAAAGRRDSLRAWIERLGCAAHVRETLLAQLHGRSRRRRPERA